MLPLCEKFGFDKKRINQRLAFLRLSKPDHKLAHRLKLEVIAPNVNKIIDQFYENLLFHQDSRKWLLDGATIEKLKNTQSQYLLSLGIGFDTEEYFESRLKIGVVHAALGLPLSTYQCAYSNLLQYISDTFPETIRKERRDFQATINFLIKITSLDMSLATETYHFSFLNELEDEVKSASLRETRLRSQIETDALTGLLTRTYAFNRLNEAIKNAHQNSGHFSLVMLDIDHFKNVNDTYGHQTGDEVLKQAVKTIIETLRDQDIAGRYGGEEFILGLVDVAPEAAGKIADRLRNQLANSPIFINEHVLYITVSIGLACLGSEEDLQSLIKRADSALYSAKASGRNCVILSEC